MLSKSKLLTNCTVPAPGASTQAVAICQQLIRAPAASVLIHVLLVKLMLRPDLQRPVLSREALDVAKRLGRLSPSEGLGIMTWMLSSLAQDVSPENASSTHPWLQGFALFAAASAEICERKQRRN